MSNDKSGFAYDGYSPAEKALAAKASSGKQAGLQPKKSTDTQEIKPPPKKV